MRGPCLAGTGGLRVTTGLPAATSAAVDMARVAATLGNRRQYTMVTQTINLPRAVDILKLPHMELGAPTSMDDSNFGSVDLFYSDLPDEIHSPVEVENLFLELQKLQFPHPSHAAEFDKFAPRKVQQWRTAVRLACVNTQVKLGSNLKKDRALRLTRAALGPCCPSDAVIQNDACRAMAIALTLLTRKIVTPQRANACFHRPINHGFEMSEYGQRVLDDHNVLWPPQPAVDVELADSDHCISNYKRQKLQ